MSNKKSLSESVFGKLMGFVLKNNAKYLVNIFKDTPQAGEIVTAAQKADAAIKDLKKSVEKYEKDPKLQKKRKDLKKKYGF